MKNSKTFWGGGYAPPRPHHHPSVPYFKFLDPPLTVIPPFTRGIHEANVFKIHVHDVCSKFASCLVPPDLLGESFTFASSCKQSIN